MDQYQSRRRRRRRLCSFVYSLNSLLNPTPQQELLQNLKFVAISSSNRAAATVAAKFVAAVSKFSGEVRSKFVVAAAKFVVAAATILVAAAMGNCQASDAVATLIEYPNGRLERLYWTISARQVMLQNPGYYVAVYVWPKPSSSPKRKPKMKILPPSAILATGNCYRLISFEDMMNNFSSRKIGSSRASGIVDAAILTAPNSSSPKVDHQCQTFPDSSDLDFQIAQARNMLVSKAWKPSLQSIAETL